MFVETGGTGLMGRELSKIMKVIPLKHEDIDIKCERNVRTVLDKIEPDLVIHLAAMTDLVRAEKEKCLTYQTNVVGSRNVSRWVKTLYISTDYVFDGEKGYYKETDIPNPLNYYSLTKLLGEDEVLKNGGKVLRLSFKPRPYEHNKVPREMYFSGGYVDDMAKEIKWAAENFKLLAPLTHVGFRRISLLDFARQTRDVKEMSIKDVPVLIPRDVSLDLSLWKKTKCLKD
jgi:dTDP-4-dehydrorhamnose reductase